MYSKIYTGKKICSKVHIYIYIEREGNRKIWKEKDNGIENIFRWKREIYQNVPEVKSEIRSNR